MRKQVLLAIFICTLAAQSILAAVQIVVLNVQDAGSNRITYNYLCWLNSPNPLPAPNFVSQWKALGASAGPTTAQVTALQNGTVVEQFASLTVSSSTLLSAVESTLTSDCASRQTYLTNIPGQGIYYGQTWNGTTWAQQ